jgi:hypothetical protein
VRLVDRYLAERRAGEPFTSWARRTEHQELLGTLAGARAGVGGGGGVTVAS